MSVRAVFGGSKGIGAAIARRFLVDSADQVVILSRSGKEIDQLLNRLEEEGFGSRIHGMVCDVRDSAAVNECTGVIQKQHGCVKVLVNAAGINRDSLFVKATDQDIADIIQTNLIGTMNTCRSVMKSMMKERHGCIINIGSTIGSYGRSGQSVYAASKSGLIGFTKSLAQEVGARGIRVNLISPGAINTDMTNILSDHQKQKMESFSTMRRYGTPEEVADVAEFLVKATYVNGEVIHVDGGLHV